MRTLTSLLLTIAMGCSDPETSAPPRVLAVGAIAPLTGASANPYWASALELAVADLNRALASTPAGRNIQFELRTIDSTGSEPLAMQAAKDLVDGGALTLWTDTSGISASVNGLNYAQPALGVPIVCAPCTDAGFHNAPIAMKLTTDPQKLAGYVDDQLWLRRTAPITDPHWIVQIRDILSRGGSSDGDVDGNGYVKLVFIGNPTDTITATPTGGGTPASYTYTAAGGNALQIAKFAPQFVPPSKLILEGIPGATGDAATINFGPSLAKIFDSFNETTGRTDGPPDFVINRIAPQYYLPFLTAYTNLGYRTMYPGVRIANGSSFVRTSTLLALGDLINGQEAVSNVLASENASGEAFLKGFKEATGYAAAGYDANVYDAVMVAMLGVLVAALPREDPEAVTRAEVKTALDRVNMAGGRRFYANELAKGIAAIEAGTTIDFEGVSGPVDFDGSNHVRSNIAVITVEGGNWTVSSRFDCVSDDLLCPQMP